MTKGYLIILRSSLGDTNFDIIPFKIIFINESDNSDSCITMS